MDQTQWKLIYETYQRSLFLYALSLTKNVPDAEDLIQETFLKAFLSYKETGSLKAWLITVLKNEFLNLCRKRQKEILDNGEWFSQQQAASEELLQKIIHQEERRTLLYAIMELPLLSKEILMESIYFHIADSEIAAMHHLTQENVRQIRSRAKKKILKRLEGTL